MKISLSKPLLFIFLSGLAYNSTWATVTESATDQKNKALATTNEDFNLLYQIPSWIDAAPSFLPLQSDELMVRPILETADRTWVDRKQFQIRNWADYTSNKIDNWFGETDPEKPASATLRVIVDNSWNKYDGYEIKPRIRGKIKLPTLERKSV